MPYKDIDGILVAVVPNKDHPNARKDVIVVPENDNASSMRSNTELVNDLKKRDIDQEKIKDVVEWVSGKLRGDGVEEEE